jgi:hypothetical protein
MAVVEEWGQPIGYGRRLTESKYQDFFIDVFKPSLRDEQNKLRFHQCSTRKCDVCRRNGYPYFTRIKTYFHDGSPPSSISLRFENGFEMENLWSQRKICVEDFDSLNDFLIKVVVNHFHEKISDCSQTSVFTFTPNVNSFDNLVGVRCESCVPCKTLAWF